MSDEKKKNKRVLFIIITVILILIALGVAGCFLYPQIRAGSLHDPFGRETHANDTSTAASDRTSDEASNPAGTDPEARRRSGSHERGPRRGRNGSRDRKRRTER